MCQSYCARRYGERWVAWSHIARGLMPRGVVRLCQNERVHEKLSYYERGSDPSTAYTLVWLRWRRRAGERQLTSSVAWFLPLSL